MVGFQRIVHQLNMGTEEMTGDRDACKAERLPRTGSAEPRPRTPPVETFACGPPNPVFGKSSLGLRPTSGNLADDLEGRLSTGGSERASYGVWL